MGNKNFHPVLCAVMGLLIITLACSSLNSTPGASNFYMATDKEGAHRTNVFSPTDDFYVFFKVSGIESGTNFQSRWYILDRQGQDPNTPIQKIDYSYEQGVKSVYFKLSGIEDWPPATYKVEIYMNDVKVGEQTFSVK